MSGTLFFLFHHESCSLCSQAWEILAALGLGEMTQKVDIDDHPEYKQRYAIRIPVLRHKDGWELYWPFTAEQIQELVEK